MSSPDLREEVDGQCIVFSRRKAAAVRVSHTAVASKCTLREKSEHLHMGSI